MKSKIINLKNRYISAIEGNIDLSISEENNKNDDITISLKNGYWQINDKPIKKCSIVKQRFFDEYIRMKLIKFPIINKNTFKNRSQEVKSQFNHIFNFPNEQKRFFNNDYKEIIFIAKN
jgi:hypothetical protein